MTAEVYCRRGVIFSNFSPLLDISMRRELFAHHLPNPKRVRADYAVLAELSRGLSGGDIRNVCVNAIYVERSYMLGYVV